MRGFIVIAALFLACHGAPVDKKAEIIDLLKSMKDIAGTHVNQLKREMDEKIEEKMSQAKACGPEVVNCVAGKVEEFKKAVMLYIEESGLALVGPTMDFTIKYVEKTIFTDADLNEIKVECEAFLTIVLPKNIVTANARAADAGLAFAKQANACMQK